MPHFFVQALIPEIDLPPEDAHHACRVLRLKAGERCTVSDGNGAVRDAELCLVSPERLRVRLLDGPERRQEPKTRVTLYMARMKGQKWEQALEKAVELGVSRVVPFQSKRCVAQGPLKQPERLQRIARAAAMQSVRGVVPEVGPCLDFERAVLSAAEAELPLFCYEDERRQSLSKALRGKTPATLAILTGPEGGFTEQEAAFARVSGCRCVSLGPRVLRCETAPIAALCAVLYSTGGMEPPDA